MGRERAGGEVMEWRGGEDARNMYVDRDDTERAGRVDEDVELVQCCEIWLGEGG